MSTSPSPVSIQRSESNRIPPAQRPKTFADRFVNFWWVEIPLKVRRYSTLLSAAWSDGIYLTAWPRVATILVLALFLFGFAEGATHWSYRTIVGTNGFAGNVLAPMATANDWGGPTHLVFADNLLLLMIGVAFGTLSANLGITLVIGYAVGNLFGPPLPFGPGWPNIDPFNAWIYRHVPLLTSYILFFMLAALPILMAMELARTSHQRVARSKALMVTVTALIDAALIYCWGAFAPMVFRTVPLWSGVNSRINVPFYSHITEIWLVPTAIVAVVTRAIISAVSANDAAVRGRARIAATRALDNPLRVPQWVRAVGAAAVITLVIMGFMRTPDTYEPSLLTNFGEAKIVFVVLAAALLLRAYSQERMPAWRRWSARVERYPTVFRLAAATAATYALCRVLVATPGLQSVRPGEFGPELASVLVGLGLTMVLLPHGWFGGSTSARVLPRWRVPRIQSPATQSALIVLLLLLVTEKAYADCLDFLCCFLGLGGTAGAAAAGGIPSLAGLGGGAATGDPCAGLRQAVEELEQAVKRLEKDIDNLNWQIGLETGKIVSIMDAMIKAQANMAEDVQKLGPEVFEQMAKIYGKAFVKSVVTKLALSAAGEVLPEAVTALLEIGHGVESFSEAVDRYHQIRQASEAAAAALTGSDLDSLAAFGEEQNLPALLDYVRWARQYDSLSHDLQANWDELQKWANQRRVDEELLKMARAELQDAADRLDKCVQSQTGDGVDAAA